MTTRNVYLGLGSNIEPGHYLPVGLRALQALLGPLDISPIYESAAVGFSGPAFQNLVVGASTRLSLRALTRSLRAIEFAHGRTEDCGKFSSRTLDIDLLTFGDYQSSDPEVDVPRAEITLNAFVLRPFAELAPELVIPGQHSTLHQLWHQFDASRQPLQRVSLDWPDTLPCWHRLSHAE